MKSYTFPYYIKFGKGDISEGKVTCSLSEKDALKLEKSARWGGRFHLDEDDEIEYIYDKVFNKVIAHETDILLKNPEIVDAWLSYEEDYIPEHEITEEDVARYLENNDIGINYPTDLQMLERSLKPPCRAKKYEKIVILRDKAKAFLADKNNRKTKIVFVDGGETLINVPTKYSGSFTIQSSVKTLWDKSFSNPFYNRDGITEIIIEEGLTEIPDWIFEGCSSLERVVIPSSVKRIGFNAFTKCSRLKSVEMSEGVQVIDSSAFRYCFDLKELHIPASVGSISMHITSYGSGIKQLYFKGTNTVIDNTRCRMDEWDNISIYVPHASEAERFLIENDIKYELI